MGYEIEEVHHDCDMAHNLLHSLGDSFGYWWIIILVGIGASTFFRKKIFKFFKGDH